MLGTRIACDSAWALFTFHTHTHTHNAACRCTDLDFHTQTRLRWDLVSPHLILVFWRLRGCGHVRKSKRVFGTLCPINLVTWLTGWWSHVGSICDRFVYQVYIVNLRLAVSKETNAVFSLSTTSTATGRVQWVSVFVEHFSLCESYFVACTVVAPLMQGCLLIHEGKEEAASPFRSTCHIFCTLFILTISLCPTDKPFDTVLSICVRKSVLHACELSVLD